MKPVINSELLQPNLSGIDARLFLQGGDRGYGCQEKNN